jgi:hypothetical protein
MTYTVIWSMTAIQRLGQLVGSAENPQSIQRAAEFVDYLLRRVPKDMGESRNRNARVWFEDVLGVYYTIDEDRMIVNVLLVGLARRR